MKKKHIIALIITAIIEISCLTTSLTLAPKYNKILQQEQQEQYDKLGYWNSETWTSQERYKKYSNLSGAIAAPLIISNLCLMAYWIPELYEINKNTSSKQD